MAAYFSPAGNEQQSDQNGAPVSGALITTYAAGTTTPITTYTDSAGLVPQANPIVCNSSGYPSSSIYLPAGQAVKLVFTTSVASGSVAYRPTVDGVTGVNDPSFATTVSEWTPFTGTPTYISATSFSLTGDQTNTFQAGRRIKTTNTGGTVYGTIRTAVYGVLTTVTVLNDSGVLDAGLSAVSYGLLSVTNPSVPNLSGRVLQELVFTDAGSTTAAGALTSVTSSAKSITPKSSNSTFVVECSFSGNVLAAGAGTNATAAFRLYNNTGAANIGVGEMLLGVSSSAGTNAQTDAPCTVRATLANAATTAVAFVLRARYTGAATTVGATSQQWTIREIQN